MRWRWNSSPSATGRGRARRRVLLGAITSLLALAAVEASSAIGIALVESVGGIDVPRTTEIYRDQSDRIRHYLRRPAERRDVLDPVLGWRYRAGHRSERDELNSQGLRSRREYAAVPAPGTLRVAAFGDSFVYCNEVANTDAWPSLIEEMHTGVEMLNYGVGGYGTDQAYLRYQAEGRALSPHIVLIGFAPVDLPRVVNVYRRFLHHEEYALVKPRFDFAPDGSLELLPNPYTTVAHYERVLAQPQAVLALGLHDQWYERAMYENPLYDWSATVRLLTVFWSKAANRYFSHDRLIRDGVFDSSSTAFRIQAAIVQRFAREVRDAGATPIVLMLPDASSIERASHGEPLVYEPLTAHLRAGGIEVIDVINAFTTEEAFPGAAPWFASGGHYSPEGNRVVSAWLGGILTDRARAHGRLGSAYPPDGASGTSR
ncbi:MAG: hypothetical protein ACRENI_09295 [Gemmatimonadaceae bacterium]